jgi:hypothetical protein
MLNLNPLESQLQQIETGIAQLNRLPTPSLRLKLLRDQYLDKSQDLLETVRCWYEATDAHQQNVAFQLMTQKYTLLNSMWLQIAAMGN